MANEDNQLIDGTIILKPFELEDAAAHLAGEDIEQETWLSGGKSTLESVQTWISKNQEYWKNDGPIFNFAVWVNEKLVGMVEANTDKERVEGMEDGQANISYGIYPEYRGKGYAIKAVNLLLGFIKSKGLEQALIRINPTNIKSLSIPIKCGFKEIGEIKIKEGNVLRLFVKNL